MDVRYVGWYLVTFCKCKFIGFYTAAFAKIETISFFHFLKDLNGSIIEV